MQEAYRQQCSMYTLCCPNWVPPLCPDLARGGTYLGTSLGRVPPWQGTPLTGYPPAGYPPQGTPLWLDLAGYPPNWTWQGTPWLDLVGYPPGVCPMAFWEMLQSIMGYGYPPGCEQTNKVKLLPSCHTTHTGGNEI